MHCLSCRATLRAYISAPHEIAALLPLGLEIEPASQGLIGQLSDGLNLLTTSLQERIAGFAPALHLGAETSLAKKAVAVSTLVAALATGGVAVERAASGDGAPSPPPAATSLPSALAPTAGAEPSGVNGAAGAAPESKNLQDAEVTDAIASDPSDRSGKSTANKPATTTNDRQETGVNDPLSEPVQPLDSAPAGADRTHADPGLNP